MGSIDFPYDYETVKLDSGDTIIFYTDGVPEAMNINEEEFGEKRFEELLLSNRDLHPNDLSKVIFNEIKKYRGEAEQSDDITLGILRIK
jgi:serine phosphatase RsbU (regulator of sigma subunit)